MTQPTEPSDPQVKIGIVVPSNNTVIEPELNTMRPNGVTVHAARVLSYGNTPDGIIEMERSASRALDELKAGHLSSYVYACLATSLVKGPEWTDAFGSRLGANGNSSVITTAAEATLSAIRVLEIQRVALATAYPARINVLLPQFFAFYGIEVVSIRSLEMENSLDLWRLKSSEISALGKSAVTSKSQALCLLGTDVPTLDVVASLEGDLGIPVLSTNQAILWRALSLVGFVQPVAGYGRLFEMTKARK